MSADMWPQCVCTGAITIETYPMKKRWKKVLKLAKKGNVVAEVEAKMLGMPLVAPFAKPLLCTMSPDWIKTLCKGLPDKNPVLSKSDRLKGKERMLTVVDKEIRNDNK